MIFPLEVQSRCLDISAIISCGSLSSLEISPGDRSCEEPALASAEPWNASAIVESLLIGVEGCSVSLLGLPAGEVSAMLEIFWWLG